uniref:Helicase ATP-binding domain-containing protein n=1 Tax=Meloidogyne hapla TaxID=6305 RepID=A0A1I8BMB3_MELHA
MPIQSQQRLQTQELKSVVSQIEEQQHHNSLGPYQQKHVQLGSVHGSQQQCNRQQYLQTGNGITNSAVVGYPTPYQTGYSPNIIQNQANQVQYQLMADGSEVPVSSSIGIAPPHHQPSYLSNPYNITRQQQQHQHIYRELFECDQQLASLIPQVQQNPELAMRVEKIQIRRQYLHAQLMQINYAMNTAVSAAMGSDTTGGHLHSSGGFTIYELPYLITIFLYCKFTEMQLSTSSHSVATSQFSGQYSPQFSGQSSQHQVGLHFPACHQQKLANHNSNPYSQQQNCVQLQQYHPTPPVPPAPYHSYAVGANIIQQPLSPTTTRQYQQHQQIASIQQYIPPLPNMSSPSVAVMSASNQVQVNIRPELPGRTLISVYHGQNIQPNMSQPAISSASMNYDVPEMQQMVNYKSQRQYQFPNRDDQQQDQSAKDSIPPEPLPPNLSREHKRRQQQKLQQQEQEECFDQLCLQSPDTIQPNTSAESESRLPSPPSPPMSLTSVSLSFFACETTATFSRTFPMCMLEVVEATHEAPKPNYSNTLLKANEASNKTLELNEIDNRSSEQTVQEAHHFHLSDQVKKVEITEVEVTKNDKQGDINEQIRAEHLPIQSHFKKSELVMDKSIVDEHIANDEVRNFDAIIIRNESKRGIKRRFGEDSKYLEKVNDYQILEGFDKIIQEPLVETTIELKSESTSRTQVEEKAEKAEESVADECLQDDSSTKETTPVDDFSFAFQTTSVNTYNSFSSTRKSARNTKSKRKKRKMDWNKPHDDDYVTGRSEKRPKINKRANVKRKSGSSVTADETYLDELDNEFFTEKRLSRKKETGKRAKYGEESDNEDDILNPLPEQKETKESRIVERVLGVRFAKMIISNNDLVDKNDTLDDKKMGLESKSFLKCNEEVCSISEEANKEIKDDSTKTQGSIENDVDLTKLLINDNKTVSNEELQTGEISSNLEMLLKDSEQVEEVYVKFKGFSYLHCEWKTIQELEALGDKRVASKLNRWKLKFGSDLSTTDVNVQEDDEDQRDFFNEDYTVVSRILDETYDKKEHQQYEFSSRLAIPKDKVYNNDNILREYQHEGVPLSTLGNWEREFNEWAPEINAIVYHGGAVSRKIIRDYEFFYKKADGRRRNVPKFDALITTYEDEAHRIKNRNCKLLQSGLLSLRMNHRVLLTGTPLQNNIQELFSLLNFLEPEQFGLLSLKRLCTLYIITLA